MFCKRGTSPLLILFAVAGLTGSVLLHLHYVDIVVRQRSYAAEFLSLASVLAFALWLLLRWRCSVVQQAEQSAKSQYEELLLNQQERVEHEERIRISRELHDGVGQALHVVLLRMKLLQESISPEKLEEYQSVSQLIKDVQGALSELRNLVVSLRPLPLSDMKIDEAIRWLCRNLEKDGDLSLLLQVAGEYDDVSDRCSLALFRVCQEGLTNILKHAAARRVQVSLQRQGDGIVLTINDDGVGGVQTGASEGSGLAIMQERIELVGGRLQIDSPQGQGTRILVELSCR